MFLNCRLVVIGEMKNDVSLMVNTTVKYLVEGVHASEALSNAQKQFSGMMFWSGIYDQWMHHLDLATSQALHQAVDSFCQDIQPQMTEDWVDAGFPLPLGCFAPGIVPDQRRPIILPYRQWSHGLSGMAFSGDAATTSSFSRVVVSHSPKNESSLKTVVQGSLSPSHRD
jgi:hypothetical protein